MSLKSLLNEDSPSFINNRKSYAKLEEVLDVPSLILVQINSFKRFQEVGLRELFENISPIKDFSEKKLDLNFSRPIFEQPKHTEAQCRERDVTYSAPLFVDVKLLIKVTGEVKEQKLYLGDIPLMTYNGTFIINGAERVVVSQLIRSPGVYFTRQEDAASGRGICYAKLIPDRGAWLEFETSNRDIITVKVDGKRKIPITTFLRARGIGKDDDINELFKDVDTDPEHEYIKSTIHWESTVEEVGGESDRLESKEEALKAIYRKLRPGDPPSVENARLLIDNLLFNPKRYDLGRVGRYKLNKRLGLDESGDTRVLTNEDLIAIIRHIIMVNNQKDNSDDIDHLGNRRVRTVGELIQNQFRIGLLRLERTVRERMSIIDPMVATPASLINIRPIVAAMWEFFSGSQLSQFMDQTNPLSELTHKRRLSALGPGGLSRERAGFEVRDVHHSHYGRICPIETPEGPNVGLIGSLATYARVNDYGFIETPYRRVLKSLSNIPEEINGRCLAEAIQNPKRNVDIPAGTLITPEISKELSQLSSKKIRVKPFVSDRIEYFTADKEEEYVIAQANAKIDEKGQFLEESVEVRQGNRYFKEVPEKIDCMDVSTKQIVSVTTSMIPFLEHDDANRALMGSNMQRQAVPLLRPEAPIVATGMERLAARDSGQVIAAEKDGIVISADGNQITIKGYDGKEYSYPMVKFRRTNQSTCINQRSIVQVGEVVKAGQILADSSSTDRGELALGQNILCAFMCWEGYNFEDAIILSEELVRDDKFTSVHVEKYELEAQVTKLGPEEVTRDIPNVGEEGLRNLDEYGIVRVGAEVKPGDILVGKITPKGETELTAEAKLLRAIFGEKAREVRDTSLRVPHGEQGTVIDVKIFSKEKNEELPAGINQLVKVWVARKRKIAVGDKMAGRHGNKGVISRILPVEDMPFLPDGRPIQIILNPIGVPSRMNLGQIFEALLGMAAENLGFRVLSPVFNGATDKQIEDALARAWLVQVAMASGIDIGDMNGSSTHVMEDIRDWLENQGYNAEMIFSDEYPGEAKRVCLNLWLESEQGKVPKNMTGEELQHKVEELCKQKEISPPIWGKTIITDGRTGEPYDKPVTVGNIYMMKLIHLVEDKIHARSTGSYSLITQQPLGGKSQFGGQRFGEMEVWTLEAYGAAHVLQEMLTVKSDDMEGRAKTYQAIVKGEDIVQPGIPESFNVLVKEMQSLGLSVEVLNEIEERVPMLKKEFMEDE